MNIYRSKMNQIEKPACNNASQFYVPNVISIIIFVWLSRVKVITHSAYYLISCSASIWRKALMLQPALVPVQPTVQFGPGNQFSTKSSTSDPKKLNPGPNDTLVSGDEVVSGKLAGLELQRPSPRKCRKSKMI